MINDKKYQRLDNPTVYIRVDHRNFVEPPKSRAEPVGLNFSTKVRWRKRKPLILTLNRCRYAIPMDTYVGIGQDQGTLSCSSAWAKKKERTLSKKLGDRARWHTSEKAIAAKVARTLLFRWTAKYSLPIWRRRTGQKYEAAWRQRWSMGVAENQGDSGGNRFWYSKRVLFQF